MNQHDEGMTTMADSMIRRYLTALDDFKVSEILELFAPQAVYIRSVVNPEGVVPGALDVLCGIDEIANYLATRGPRSLRHKVEASWRTSNREFMEISVEDPGSDVKSIALASAVLDEQGRIARYLACSGQVSGAGLAAAFAGGSGLQLPRS